MSSGGPAIRDGNWRGVESSLADKGAHAMNVAVAETRRPIQQDLRFGLIEGAFGGLVFISLQRWWNPRDTRVRRIGNYVAALVIVGIGSLWGMTAIYR